MANKQAGGLRWLGTHAIIGVPARDLSPEEAARHGEAIAAAEKAHGFALYEALPAASAPAGEPSSQKKE